MYGDENTLVRPRPISVEGCLTASGDRFVLTQLGSDAQNAPASRQPTEPPVEPPNPTTETYRLVGMDNELRPLVGQRVRITGEAEPEQVVDLRSSAPPGPPAPADRQATGTTGRHPQVGTIETAHIEINDLQVRSVSATGERCIAAER